MEINADFNLNQSNIDADFSIESTEIDALFKINAAGTTWGSISGDIANQTDLKNVIDTLSGQIDSNHGAITELALTMQGYGDIVSYNASDFATPAQGALADTALQPGDNISELINNSGYITASDLPEVNNSVITVQKNGVNVKSFSLNQAESETINITVPTDTSDLTNNAGFITSASLPIVNNATLTIQKNGTTVDTFTANSSSDVTVNITVPVDNSELSNGAGYISGIDSSDVVTALGYTPYDNSNPDGFISGINSTDVVTALGYTPYNSTNPNGYITSSDIPTLEDLTTTAQLAAINSGATTTNIGQIATNTQAISTETTNRQNADNNLQSQIDAITAASDVTDIVGTYAQLQAYDTTSLPNNSIIKVLQDESKDDETTYYRWVITGGVGSWVLIGEEGPYYTKSESDSTFVPLTRTVNGQALSNNITLTASDVGALPSSTVIPTVNNSTITIQKNGTDVNSFSLNQASGETINITVPTDTNDLTNGAGFITSADLPTNYVTTNTNQNISGYKNFTNGFVTSGITCNNSTFTVTVNNKILMGCSSNNIDIGNGDRTITFLPSSTQTRPYWGSSNNTLALYSDIPTIPTNYVTTDTAQDISGRKTFLGEKAIYFKQNAVTNKLGFTLYNPSSTELGAFEYRPNTISGGALLNVNVPYSSSDYVGFRYWGTAVNIVAPKVSTAGSYYIPTHITNGTTTVTANNTGTVDISSLLSDFVTDSDLATTLSSYATQSWVGQQGFLTGITSSDVTTALGYTPVNKAGDTMSGTLTIDKSNSTLLNLKGSSTTILGVYNNFDYSTATTSGNCYSDVIFYDYLSNTRRNTIRSHYTYDNTGTLTGSKLIIGTNKFDGSAPQGLAVNYNGTSGYITSDFVPISTSSTSNNNIPTCGWVNDATKATNVVHRDSAETIAGAKTFTDNPTISRSTYSRCILKTTDWTKGANPTSSTNSGVVIEDVNSNNSQANRLGEFITQLNSNGSIYSAMGIYKNEAGTTNSQIRIGYNTGGNVYTYAPASDANDSIVTTVAKSKSSNGYFKLGNGLIIQWGRFQNSANSIAVTFPTAFSSTNYYARATQEQSSSTSGEYGQGSSFTTTGCTFTAYKGTNYYSRWIAIGY